MAKGYLDEQEQSIYNKAFGISDTSNTEGGYLSDPPPPEGAPADATGTGFGDFAGDIYSDIKEQDWLLPTLTGVGVGVGGYKAEPKEIDTINPRYEATTESRSVNFEMKNYDIDTSETLRDSEDHDEIYRRLMETKKK